MTTKETLQKLDEFLSDESKWTQRSWARDSNGANCGIYDVDARCWCLEGALCTITKDDVFARAKTHLALTDIVKSIPNAGANYLTGYNDLRTTSFADVKKLIRDAIAREEGT